MGLTRDTLALKRYEEDGNKHNDKQHDKYETENKIPVYV